MCREADAEGAVDNATGGGFFQWMGRELAVRPTVIPPHQAAPQSPTSSPAASPAASSRPPARGPRDHPPAQSPVERAQWWRAEISACAIAAGTMRGLQHLGTVSRDRSIVHWVGGFTPFCVSRPDSACGSQSTDCA